MSTTGATAASDAASTAPGPARWVAEDDGFASDAEPGSPLSALALAMAAPPPTIMSGASPYDTAPESKYATDPAVNAAMIPDTNVEVIDDDDDFLIAQPNVVQRLITTIKSSRLNMGLAAGAVGLVVLVSALTFCGGSSSKGNQVAASKRANDNGSAAPTKVAATEAEPVTPVETPKPEPVAPIAAPTAEPTGPTPEELAAAAEPTPATTTVAPKRDPAVSREPKTNTTTGTTGGKKLGGKQVILEYDAQARETKPVASAAKADQAAIQKARTAYAAGNQRLFAGDGAAAIKLYRQSLGFYPGYVAGYRGLGLAYAQQGDKPNALKALRTYISSVPTAKDAALIRKRISSLSGK